MNMTAWLIWMGVSVLLAFLIFSLIQRDEKKRFPLAALSLLLSLPLGTVCSKLFYYLAQLDFMIADGWLESLVNLNLESFSFFGGTAGVCLAVFLAAKLLHIRPLKALDSFAPAGLLLAGLVRFGEYFLDMLGTGPYMEAEAFCFFPLSVGFDYGDGWVEWYLAVFVLEGFTLLCLSLVSQLCFARHRFLRSLFYLCLPQILFENLRTCSFWWFFCIRVEQLLCMVVMFIILCIYAGHSKGQKWRWISPILALLCAGIFIVSEFAMEQKIEALSFMSVGQCYALMGLGMILLLLAELTGYARMKRAMQK